MKRPFFLLLALMLAILLPACGEPNHPPTDQPTPTITVTPSSTPEPEKIFLSDLTPVSAEVGHAYLGRGIVPWSEGEALTEGAPIVSGGTTYEHGLFAHAPSTLVYDLSGRYSLLYTSMLVHSGANCGDGATFHILVDGAERFASPVLNWENTPVTADVDATGAHQLTLLADMGGDAGCDWAIWGDPYLLPAGEATLAAYIPPTATISPTATPQSVFIYLADLVPYSSYSNTPVEAGIFPVTRNDLGVTAGQLLAWHGWEFPYGMLLGPDTTLTYDITGQNFFRFHADVTRIFSDSGCGDGVDVVLMGDMREIARLHMPQNSDAVVPLEADVNNVRMLTLLVDPIDNYDCDELILGDPLLHAYADPTDAPAPQPTRTPAAHFSEPIPEKMVWAYYYGWYQPLSPWMWWEDPRWIDYPLGRYNSMDVEVIHQQIQRAKSAGIDGFVVLWLGIEDPGDSRQIQLLLDAAEQEDFKVIVSFEWPKGIPEATSSLHYLLVNFAGHPAYMRVGGKPAVFLYANSQLGPAYVWQGVFDDLQALGLDAFYIGESFSLTDLAVFDGLYQYIPTSPSIYSGFGERFDAYMQAHPGEERLWIATALPGFDNTPNVTVGWASPDFIDPQGGEYYRQSLQTALDSGAPWILITSWNEYTENTEIEPSENLGTLRLDITRELILPWKDE